MKVNDYLVPKRWNQGCYDLLQILADGVVQFVQITMAETHSFKIRYVIQVCTCVVLCACVVLVWCLRVLRVMHWYCSCWLGSRCISCRQPFQGEKGKCGVSYTTQKDIHNAILCRCIASKICKLSH